MIPVSAPALGSMIRFVDVTKTYGSTSASAALEAVNLEFHKGEFAFITGPSGAGKSTLLKLVYAAESPTRGDVFVEDRSVGRLHPRSIPYLRRNLGVVFQDFELLPRRSILHNVGLALEVCGVGRDEIDRRARDVLARVGLGRKADRRPGELSGGEQQRVAIARALVNDPTIVLADEPTGNLDEELSADILELLRALCEAQGATVLVATHDPVLLAEPGTRIVRLDEGRVVSDGLDEAGGDDDQEAETVREDAP
jgi:cell division transport system ATP-binding protein